MINKVILTGRITKDIELRQTLDGTNYAFFTLAVSRQGSKEDNTDFISCVAWRKTSEFMNKYLMKGSLIGVEGKLDVYRTQKDGNYETKVNVNVSQVHFMESKKDNPNSIRSEDVQDKPIQRAKEYTPAPEDDVEWEKIDNATNEDSKFDTSSEKTNNEEINFDDIQF